MGKRGKKRKQRRQAEERKASSGRPRQTFEEIRRTGHYRGTSYSDVYRDGKAYVYTAWNDNEDMEGTPMSWEEWLRPYRS